MINYNKPDFLLTKPDNYDLFHNKSNKIIHEAFIINENTIKVVLKTLKEIKPLDVKLYIIDYLPVSNIGEFNIEEVNSPRFWQNNNSIFFENCALNLNNNYIIEIAGERHFLYLDPSIGGILDTKFDCSNISDLGVKYNGTSAVFKVWSPPAARITLCIFDKEQNPVLPKLPIELTKGENGLWATEIVASDFHDLTSLDGLYYQYEVYAYGKKNTALDPYAKSMAEFNPYRGDYVGKGAIVNLNKLFRTGSANYNNSTALNGKCDMIAYEIHIRDFSIEPGQISNEIAGTFRGAIEKIQYLKDLGITHVQIMPITKTYTLDETDRLYKNENAENINYNWGYDVHNYFTPEGLFTSDSSNPYTRIEELKSLTQALHNAEIGVIFDVVFNHTYAIEVFENIAPGCYFRYNSENRISGTTGAGPSLESRRKMTRKLIIDSLSYFVKMFNADGFRFDLMSFIDHHTMTEIRSKVGEIYCPGKPESLILQGEGWCFSDISLNTDSPINTATMKLNYPNNIQLGIFNDSTRDSFTGRDYNIGYVQGNYNEKGRVAAGIIAGLRSNINYSELSNDASFFEHYNRFAEEPFNCLNYLSIHDGFTLWDKLNLSVYDPSGTERMRLMKMALAMLFVSQGNIILHGGDEILRTKPLARNDKEKNRAHTSQVVTEENGCKYFHENTYCSCDFTNMIRWSRFTNEYSEKSTEMFDFLKGLIKMRRNISLLRINSSEDIQKSFKFISPENNANYRAAIVFSIESEKNVSQEDFTKIIVLINPYHDNVTLKIADIDSSKNWKLILNAYKVHTLKSNIDCKNITDIIYDSNQILSERKSVTIIGY